MRYEVLIDMGIVGPNAQYKILDERNAHLEILVALADGYLFARVKVLPRDGI